VEALRGSAFENRVRGRVVVEKPADVSDLMLSAGKSALVDPG
jgi:hypothetical protein